MTVLASYAAFVGGVRLALLYVGVLIFVICAVDWAVRTRRINPFSRAARFFRARIEPAMRPIERVIVRAGGVPSSASWWALVAYAVAGILLITLLQFAGRILTQIIFAASAPSTIPMVLASWAFGLLKLALLVRVLSSWFPVSPYSRWIRWSYVLTEWMIAPLRRVVPTLGVIDITPIIAWFLLSLIQSALGVP